MALGAYSEESLAEVRGDVGEARKLLVAGTDPMAKRKADKVGSRVAAESSFESMARASWAHWKPTSPVGAQRCLAYQRGRRAGALNFFWESGMTVSPNCFEQSTCVCSAASMPVSPIARASL